MNNGNIDVFCGNGNGKTSAALGRALLMAVRGNRTIIIHFLKAKDDDEAEYFKKMEPEIKLFRFEKMDTCFADLSQDEKQEEISNMKNGLNFAKKVLLTGECELLILDEILGLVDEGIIDISEISALIDAKPDDISIIMTGRVLPEGIRDKVDNVSVIDNLG